MRFSLNTFRKFHAAQEQMIRVMMPRTSVRDLAPLAPFAQDGVPVARARWNLGRRYEQKASFTLAEVAHG